MIKWYKVRDDWYEGYDDDTYVLSVRKTDLWTWEYVPGMWEGQSFNTSEEAIEHAEEWYSNLFPEVNIEYPEWKSELYLELDSEFNLDMDVGTYLELDTL